MFIRTNDARRLDRPTLDEHRKAFETKKERRAAKREAWTKAARRRDREDKQLRGGETA